MKKVKITAALLASLLGVLAFGACSDTQGGDALTIGRSNEKFKFICYGTPFYENIGETPYGAHPDQNTPENWRIIADCGFNYAMPINDIKHEHIVTTLERAQEVGMKVIIMDYLSTGLPQLIKRSENRSYNDTMALIKQSEDVFIQRYTEYAAYDSFAGIHVVDEPSMDAYDAISAGQDWWYEHFQIGRAHV